jgi:hypothetical protein
MTRTKAKANRIIIFVSIFLAISLLMSFWLKSTYKPVYPIEIAQQFLTHLQAKSFNNAHLLTVQTGLVGKTALQLEAITKQQLCSEKPLHFRWAAPTQSNGNRLRRMIFGREVEMPEVIVELENNTCLMSFTLHRVDKHWKIISFQSHAG